MPSRLSPQMLSHSASSLLLSSSLMASEIVLMSTVLQVIFFKNSRTIKGKYNMIHICNFKCFKKVKSDK